MNVPNKKAFYHKTKGQTFSPHFSRDLIWAKKDDLGSRKKVFFPTKCCKVSNEKEYESFFSFLFSRRKKLRIFYCGSPRLEDWCWQFKLNCYSAITICKIDLIFFSLLDFLNSFFPWMKMIKIIVVLTANTRY